MANILVVDDSILSRRLVVDPLHAEGHNVVEANNGELGYTAFVEQGADLIVTDLLMPVMNGFELIQRIRQDNTDVPVIVISADIQRTSREQCKSLGVSSFLNKPVTADDLLGAVNTVLPISEGTLS